VQETYSSHYTVLGAYMSYDSAFLAAESHNNSKIVHTQGLTHGYITTLYGNHQDYTITETELCILDNTDSMDIYE